MADTFSKVERSAVMQKVKSKGNKSTEQKLINLFKENGIKGWRRNYPVVGKPDFVFLKQKVAVFADGCFWHGHHCRNITPQQNSEYWNKKRERNILRDETVTKLLVQRGWKVLRFWECAIKSNDINLMNVLNVSIRSAIVVSLLFSL
jgi:DNA mismatch endonuclease, patch repair protein